jgi:hypothetical protein
MRILLTIMLCGLACTAFAQAPARLQGLEYRGTAEVQWQEGCEGCGNPGHVRFVQGNAVDFTLPGSDIIDRRRYVRKGGTLEVEGGIRIDLAGDSLFIHSRGARYAYVKYSGDQ